jgi:hypothetical protein
MASFFQHPQNRRWFAQLVSLFLLFALLAGAVWWYFS